MPTLKVSSASGISCAGSPTSSSAPAKPMPCSKPKPPAASQGRRRSQCRVGVLARELHRHHEDAERDRELDQVDRIAQETQRRQRERDAVAQRERGDRPHQAPPARDQQQQPEHEQQVIDAAEDVPDAHPHVIDRDRQRVRARGTRYTGWAAFSRPCATTPSLHCDAHQRRGLVLGQSRRRAVPARAAARCSARASRCAPRCPRSPALVRRYRCTRPAVAASMGTGVEAKRGVFQRHGRNSHRPARGSRAARARACAPAHCPREAAAAWPRNTGPGASDCTPYFCRSDTIASASARRRALAQHVALEAPPHVGLVEARHAPGSASSTRTRCSP